MLRGGCRGPLAALELLLARARNAGRREGSLSVDSALNRILRNRRPIESSGYKRRLAGRVSQGRRQPLATLRPQPSALRTTINPTASMSHVQAWKRIT